MSTSRTLRVVKIVRAGAGNEHGDEMIIMNDQEMADYMVLFEDEGVNFDEMIVMNDQE
jgi:hypothetical protein